jgi:VWFA-related protein
MNRARRPQAWRLQLILAMAVLVVGTRSTVTGQTGRIPSEPGTAKVGRVPLDPAFFQSAAAPQQPLTFRSSVKLIDIDVLVTDRDGHFIRDLTRDDFEILEDGKKQEVAAFSFVDLPIESAAAAPAAKTSMAEPDVVSNAAASGRIFALLLDSPSSRICSSSADYIPLVRRVANSFIDQFLAPGDQAAVMHVLGSYKMAQTFTTSKSLLHAAVDRYGTGLTGSVASLSNPLDNDSLDGPTGNEQAARQMETYKTLEDLATRLGSVTGRRKTILWVGAQMRFSPPVCPDTMPPRQPSDPIRNTKVDCEAVRARWASIDGTYRDAIVAATRNNVVIHAIDACGLTTVLGGGQDHPGDSAELDRAAALRQVADDTGGLSVVGTNNFAGGFQNIVRESSTYYVLGYAPPVEYKDGKFHSVQVRVKRPGAQVRSRKGYTAPRADKVATISSTLPDAVSDAVRDALRAPLSVRGLALDFFTTSFKGAGREQSVVVGGRVTGQLQLEGKQEIALSYQVFTLEGRVQTGEFKTFALDLQPDTRTRVAANGLHFVDRIALPPGRYEIRYAVNQAGGAIGSVVMSLEVPAFDEELSVSGIARASRATTGNLILRDDADLHERLGASATSDRKFPAGDSLNAYFEVYSNDPKATADDLTVSGVLTTAEGKEVGRGDARLQVEKAAEGRWPYMVEFELSDVPAGNYVLSINVTSPRRKEPVQRRIPIAVE